MTLLIHLRLHVCVCVCMQDNLYLSLSYLESEWEVRRGSTREFGPEQMQSSHCQVPLQDNSSDCGLYLLQYVESFLKVNKLSASLFLCLTKSEMFSKIATVSLKQQQQ